MIIGVLDSGIGGVAVLKELKKLPSAQHYIYYSDNINAPYGSLNEQILKKRVLEISDILVARGAEAVLFLCNTATTVALQYARDNRNVPVFGVRPDLAAIAGKTLILSTMLTAEKLLSDKTAMGAQIVGLRSLSLEIENSVPDFSALRPYLRTLTAPYTDVKTVLLACTHYIHLAPYFKEFLPNATLVTGVEPLYGELLQFLSAHPTALSAELVDAEMDGEAARCANSYEFIFSGENKETLYRAVLTGE